MIGGMITNSFISSLEGELSGVRTYFHFYVAQGLTLSLAVFLFSSLIIY